MIVAKDSKSTQEVSSSPVEFTPGASASASAPVVVMSPPPEQTQPTPAQPSPLPAVHAAPPAYSVLPASASAPHSASARGHDADHDERHYRGGDAGSSKESVHEHSAGRAFSDGLFTIVIAPLAMFLVILYGVGKIIEGVGKGLSTGPESAYRAYQKREKRRREARESRRSKARNSV